MATAPFPDKTSASRFVPRAGHDSSTVDRPASTPPLAFTPAHPFRSQVISKLKFQGDEEYQYMLTEVQLHHKVRGHPNVTELYEYSEDKANFYMVLE